MTKNQNNYQVEVIPRGELVTVGFLTRLRELESAYGNPQRTNQNLIGERHRLGTYYQFQEKPTAQGFEDAVRKANIARTSFSQLNKEQR